jgi:hypothetical protein
VGYLPFRRRQHLCQPTCLSFSTFFSMDYEETKAEPCCALFCDGS